ncbi:PH domain-containing protein [Bacillus sp. CH30_1T]|uniref:PH domain-containing protein n=1 Tax=Bacillus sp. CH30_1T TaxID=2604836 RepID=UPI0011EFA7FF|nr:PH domain-containing protein [Bacillus sp. CH30_1T]KAA0565327.1 PH domain-containing protein [Bacillus sp. CH30_1T]
MEKTILEFENYLFGLKGNKQGIIKMPKEYYELTNERLKVTKQGMITETKSDIELYRIKDITVKQKMKDKVMDVGDIEIISTDSSDPVLVLKQVKSPNEVREKIRAATKEAKDLVGVSYRQDL